MALESRASHLAVQHEIAECAARLIIDGGALSFSEAKRRAASGLGLAELRSLPDNLAVQSALIDYLRLFEGERYVARIDSMRRAALSAMESLQGFSPRLVGPVLYASACEYSPINLHLHCDEPEAPSRFFYEQQINYRVEQTRLQISSKEWGDFLSYLVTDDDFDYELVVLPLDFLSHPPLSALDGKRYRRADIVGLKVLIDEGSPSARPTAENA